MGHLNSFSASGGGNLNKNFTKNTNARGLPVGGMLKLRFDWYIMGKLSGWCVLMASLIHCWLIPSLNTLCSNIMIGTQAPSRSIFGWHSINTWSMYSCPIVNRLICANWKLVDCWLTVLIACQPRYWWRVEWGSINGILYLHKSHNTPLWPPKILHNHCLKFLLGHEDVPREI